MRRVPADGGAPVEITKLDHSRGETSHRHPAMLPDGRHFLYFAAGVQPGGSVYVWSFDDDSKTFVVASETNAAYVDGYLLFTRGETLLAQRFDATTLRTSGDPIALARNILVAPTVARAAFSGGAGTLAFRVVAPAEPTQLTWLDRSGREIGTVGEPADQGHLGLSPDGTRLALSIFDPATQTRDLWIQDLKKDARTRLTFGRNEDLHPVWSPDGRRLVVESTDNKYPGSWSSDGQRLLFHIGNARSRTGTTCGSFR